MIGQKVKLIPKHRGAYISKTDIDSPYENELTIVDEKVSNLGDRTCEVLYFEEIPNEPHVAKHFKVVNNDPILNFDAEPSDGSTPF